MEITGMLALLVNNNFRELLLPEAMTSYYDQECNQAFHRKTLYLLRKHKGSHLVTKALVKDVNL